MQLTAAPDTQYDIREDIVPRYDDALCFEFGSDGHVHREQRAGPSMPKEIR